MLWLEAELGAVGLCGKVELEDSTPTPAAFLPHNHRQHTLEKLSGESPFRSRGRTSHRLCEKILELEFDSDLWPQANPVIFLSSGFKEG